jgi:hypothetical protein
MNDEELDTWAAERIMGWTQETGFSYWPNSETVYRDATGQNCGLVSDWQPSTDWAAIGQILETLRKEWVIGVNAWPDRYETVMERSGGDYGPVWMRTRSAGPAAILAVVYAALTGQPTQERA